MYINPFVAGVISTILCEVAIVILAAIITTNLTRRK